MRVGAKSGKLSGELSTRDVGNFLNLERLMFKGPALNFRGENVAASAVPAAKVAVTMLQSHKDSLSNRQ